MCSRGGGGGGGFGGTVEPTNICTATSRNYTYSIVHDHTLQFDESVVSGGGGLFFNKNVKNPFFWGGVLPFHPAGGHIPYPPPGQPLVLLERPSWNGWLRACLEFEHFVMITLRAEGENLKFRLFTRTIPRTKRVFEPPYPGYAPIRKGFFLFLTYLIPRPMEASSPVKKSVHEHNKHAKRTRTVSTEIFVQS